MKIGTTEYTEYTEKDQGFNSVCSVVNGRF